MELNFRQVTYMRDRTHTYLWLRDQGSRGTFLTIESGTIEVVSLNLSDGVYHILYDGVMWQLTPYQYDPISAFKKYHDSLLNRTDEAAAELAEILALEPGPKPLRKPVVQKPMAVIKEAKKVKSIGAGYTLSQMCSELNMDPSEARKTLRNKGIEKPQGKWEWPNREAAEAVRKVLSK